MDFPRSFFHAIFPEFPESKMKVFLLAIAALFAAFSYFQFNDAVQFGTIQPLVVLWIFLYGFTSTTTFCTALGKGALIFILSAVGRALYIDWSHSLIFCHETNPAANETGGLILLGCWHLFLAKVSLRGCLKNSE